MPLTASRPELLPGGSDVMLRQAIHDSLAFSARMQEIRTRLGELIGLSGPAYTILITIQHLSETGDVGINRVSEFLHLSGAFVTIEIGKLVNAGLVSKTPDPDDGRRVIVRVTKKANTLLKSLLEIQRPANDLIFGGLDAKQFKAFAVSIAALVRGTDECLTLVRYRAEQRRRKA